ncbi:MAG TPA: DUF4147 domain-containing protein [Candidatus Binataceae bacterium]|nr:DUF4147 domain-containing protein [Candidatus Binataceae bacterium]
MRIFAAAVAAVEPRRVVARIFEPDASSMVDAISMIERASHVYLLAVGKAAIGMALEARDHIGARMRDALVIVPGPVTEAIDLPAMAAAHPVPDASSEAAARAALHFVAKVLPDDLVVFALSGGASALMALPAPGITLHDKAAAASLLMNSGATIRELNAVRKHLSGIKGGRMLKATRARILSLVLSDVPGNDFATVGSGPTAEDPTTYSDAVGILKRRGVWGRAPEAVRDHLERGAAGQVAETLKHGDDALERVRNIVVADNQTAVQAATLTAAALGYRVLQGRRLAGDAERAGVALAADLCGIDSEDERSCLIAGGETAVAVRGTGKGGRSQHAALAAAIELAKCGSGRRIAALFAGTDGIDGPTDAAGAIAAPDTIARAVEARIDPNSALARSDSYNFFLALGDLVITGPTGTNVADLFVGLVNY